MDQNYRNAIRTYGAGLITHIGLVNGSGVEISGGTYARKAVTWSTATNNKAIPSSDLTFNIPRALQSQGGEDSPLHQEALTTEARRLPRQGLTQRNGTYVLKADSTSINHTAV